MPLSAAPVTVVKDPYPDRPYRPATPADWYPESAMSQRPRRRSRGRIDRVTFTLTMLLLIVVGAQTVMLVNLNHRLAVSLRDSAASNVGGQNRLHDLESRTGEMERRIIDTQAVAKDVGGSVFLVEAGGAVGTAFALGNDSGGESTNPVTNYHVVKDLSNQGGREGVLQREDKRVGGQIVKVDIAADLTLLRANGKLPRLVAAK